MGIADRRRGSAGTRARPGGDEPVIPHGRRARKPGRVAHVAVAVVASAAVVGVLAVGYGPVPALGPALDPGHGVWSSAAGAALPRSQALDLPGLSRPARVAFTRHGVPSVRAADAADAFLVLGYLHARFRLAQMDLERRLGEGRLAQLDGPSRLASDKFELRLGVLRTARREWARTPRSSPAGRALLAYARGVNDYLARARARHQRPAIFALSGVRPRPWTPVDSLVVQGVLTQRLDFTTAPLDRALLAHSLGAARTTRWFPVDPRGQQAPYDPGPYHNLGVAPLSAAGQAGGVSGAAVPPGSAPGSGSGSGSGSGAGAAPQAGSGSAAGSGSVAAAATAILAQTSALPAGQIHLHPDSNAWAANGPKVAGAKAVLAGDPHLRQTLPSVWYEAALSAPGLHVTGVTVPGLPGVLIGHNRHIAWTLTDVQDQATLFYRERASAHHPGQYYWRGAWRRMRQVRYTIPVRGRPAAHLTVDLTVHGPVLTRAGQTTSVDWMGNLPSPDVAVMLKVATAANFAQFRAALARWRAPTQSFVYADDQGNIGEISAGSYPVVRHGRPWLPLPGTGADDVAGVIPYKAVPQAHNPPSHVIVTANQRPVGPSYPYYIGASDNFFAPAYRAGEISSYLRGHSAMTPAGVASPQTSQVDPLAVAIVPKLLAALRGRRLPSAQQAAAGLLRRWNGQMAAGSAAASVWWTFWNSYLSTVFGPWWKAAGVPVRADPAGLAVSPRQASLDEDLAAWTRHDPGNPAFTPPGAQRRTAPQAMRAAFAHAVAHLSAALGGAPDAWAWGKLHTRQFASLTGASALGYGPRPAGGDPWTPDSAEGGLASHAGPTWRMVVAWTGRSAATARGVYPGGQSGNPASPWYADLMAAWRKGRRLPMPPAAGRAPGATRWSLRP